MNWFEAIIYGLISGIAEFMPISSPAHQAVYRLFVGVDSVNPFQQLLIHIASLIAIFTAYRSAQELLQQRDARGNRKRRNHNLSSLDMRIIKTSFVSYLIVYILLLSVVDSSNDLLLISMFLVINGIILFVPHRMLQGNKDAKSMSSIDSVLLGTVSALSFFPGISRIGCASSLAVARGADRQQALKWSILMSIFALGAFCLIDIYQLFFYTGDAVTFYSILCWLLSAGGAYISSYLGIKLIQFLTIKTNLSGFAYYSWGAALFTFILYLTVA